MSKYDYELSQQLERIRYNGFFQSHVRFFLVEFYNEFGQTLGRRKKSWAKVLGSFGRIRSLDDLVLVNIIQGHSSKK